MEINKNGLNVKDYKTLLSQDERFVNMSNGNNQTANMTYIDENNISIYMNILVISVFLWYHSLENKLIYDILI